MSKKDYELIALVLKESDAAGLSVRGVSKAFALIFQDENPRFKANLFLKACGIE